MLKREEIRIRDPFILPMPEENCYYMYGTTALEDGSIAARTSFSVYRTEDLEHFEEPRVILDGKALGLWSTRDFWAPEVHRYNGKFYLFGSMKSDTHHRGTQIFVCDRPDGSFQPISEFPQTPEDWECLDGTFWVENGTPYMVFSHEWTQVENGEICAVPLSEDLSHAVGEPILLFRASDNPNVSHIGKKDGVFVTDGPFLFREEGKLKMIWSSFYQRRYLVLEATADSLCGPWTHGGSRFNFDGGHAMLFESLNGERMISLHAPNSANKERAMFMKF